MTKIKIGIVGGAGFAAGELLRIVINHPQVEIDFIYSRSQTGKRISSIHSDFCYLWPEKTFDEEINTNVDVVFLCVGHGEAKEFLQQMRFAQNTKIIDLSQDHRVDNTDGFIYGLTEINEKAIKASQYIANPGCFATAIALALYPLIPFIDNDIHITAITGSTGAGMKSSPHTHFSWRANNLAVYKAFSHQHLAEIRQLLKPKPKTAIQFVPIKGDFTRGIFASIYFSSHLSEQQAKQKLLAQYQYSDFVHIVDHDPDLKQVINTNNCLVNVKKHGQIIHLVSVIDNLIKGAAGQAVQNMNVMFNLAQSTGLHLKPVAF
ncbi:N-acetyl-gamma-glutamyl-phosphate reductase [Facilibium subflavum]|uniref:N-acetyl-gamma-glutamyl-phosphate reductase n=1 Tax=Facilibium subflavum TaxID=2219058 RepID=UPI000E65DD0C|nr:N-acetyl-gamma-glutamyl-phosphate reductase [Facilibium subflavum]